MSALPVRDGEDPSPSFGEAMARAQLAWHAKERERQRAFQLALAKESPKEQGDPIIPCAVAMEQSERETRARQMLERPLSEIGWWDLNYIEEVLGEAVGSEHWRAVKNDAVHSLKSGHAAAEVVTPYGGRTPSDHARFVAIRDGLITEWHPTGMTEMTLIDMLVQCRWTYERWMQRHAEQFGGQFEALTTHEENRRQYGAWIPQRLTEAASQEHSAGMATKFQNQFIKIVRALRDLRRYQPVIGTVVVNSGGQMNVGDKQVNVGGPGPLPRRPG